MGSPPLTVVLALRSRFGPAPPLTVVTQRRFCARFFAVALRPRSTATEAPHYFRRRRPVPPKMLLTASRIAVLMPLFTVGFCSTSSHIDGPFSPLGSAGSGIGGTGSFEGTGG
ncbi:hypothetical protein MINTM011_16390 [Mycobacterium paraintracellulare]|nr:hypothetical protein MINTM011_16390 [Mycobacterium paraintracellulare]BCO88431.1 hypothetical protein MINTM015_16880 [Mycobacterium paraintracellulare]